MGKDVGIGRYFSKSKEACEKKCLKGRTALQVPIFCNKAPDFKRVLKYALDTNFIT